MLVLLLVYNVPKHIGFYVKSSAVFFTALFLCVWLGTHAHIGLT